MSYSLQPHELQHSRLLCASLFPWVCSNSCPLSQWCYPTISSSVVTFSFCPWPSPASVSFPVSQLFASRSLSIRTSASASALPMNIQGWLPSELTGFISLLWKLLSKVLSSTTIWKLQFFSTHSWQPRGWWATRLLCPSGCYALLHGIFPTQGSDLGLLNLLLSRRAPYHYCRLGSPKVSCRLQLITMC